jgi:hypothetical protein
MNDPEQILGRLTPLGPSDATTAAVRSALARELASVMPARPKSAKWERRLTWLTAAAFLFGIGLNVAVDHFDQVRRQRWFEVASATEIAAARDVANMVEAVSDAETGAWVQRRLLQGCAAKPAVRASSAVFEQYLTTILRDIDHASAQENIEVPRPEPGRPDRRGAHRQRDLRLAHGQCARRTLGSIAFGGGADLIG